MIYVEVHGSSSLKSWSHVILATSTVTLCACGAGICANTNNALVKSSRNFTVTSVGLLRLSDSRIAALVYIAALAPDETETSQSQQQKFPVTEVFSHIEVADGRVWLRPDGIGAFCGDLPKAEQMLVWATQSVPVPDLFTQK